MLQRNVKGIYIAPLLLSLLLTVCVCLEINSKSVYIFPKDGSGIQNEQYEVQVTSSETPFEACTFINNNLTAPGNVESLIYWENEEKTSCKLIIASMENLFKSSKWNVSLVFSDGEHISDTFSIGMYDKSDVKEEIHTTAVAGTHFKESCAFNLNYVKVYNPAGELYAEGRNVGLDIPYVRFEDAGVWKCTVLQANSMKETYVNIFLNVTEEVMVEESVTETEDGVFLLCKHNTVGYNPCLYESPNGMIISPMEGVVSGRYSYYGNDIDKECGLAIRKPLEDDEIGMWNCLIASPELARYLYVGAIRFNGTTRTPEISIVRGMNLTVECNLRERITYCYARSPKGSVFTAFSTHQNKALYTGRGFGLGHCQLSIPGNFISENDTGTWHCGMGTAGFEDVLVATEVTIAVSNFSAVESVKEVSSGEEALLMCRSVMKYTLKYCRFSHQSGRSFNVKLRSGVGKFSYYGRGFEDGECGLHITAVTSEDFGQWTCSAGIAEGGSVWEYEDTIIVQPPSLSSSVILGLSIGLGVVVGGAAAGFIAYAHGRRNRRVSILNVATMRWETPRRRLTNSSDTSNESRSPRISANHT